MHVNGGTVSPVNRESVLSTPRPWARNEGYALLHARLADDSESLALLASGWGRSGEGLAEFRERASKVQEALRRRAKGDEIEGPYRCALEDAVNVKPLPRGTAQYHIHDGKLSLVALCVLEDLEARRGAVEALALIKVCIGCGGGCQCGGEVASRHTTGRKVRSDRLFCCGTCRKRHEAETATAISTQANDELHQRA